MILVLAGSYEQAAAWAEDTRPEGNWRYVSSASELRGWNNVTLIRVGTWYQRPDADEIIEAVRGEYSVIDA